MKKFQIDKGGVQGSGRGEAGDKGAIPLNVFRRVTLHRLERPTRQGINAFYDAYELLESEAPSYLGQRRSRWAVGNVGQFQLLVRSPYGNLIMLFCQLIVLDVFHQASKVPVRLATDGAHDLFSVPCHTVHFSQEQASRRESIGVAVVAKAVVPVERRVAVHLVRDYRRYIQKQNSPQIIVRRDDAELFHFGVPLGVLVFQKRVKPNVSLDNTVTNLHVVYPNLQTKGATVRLAHDAFIGKDHLNGARFASGQPGKEKCE